MNGPQGQSRIYGNLRFSYRITSEVFGDWNEITPQIHIRKFEKQTAGGWVPWLTSSVSELTQRTLWMSEMTTSKAPVLKPVVLQIFWYEIGEWFSSILQKNHLYSNFNGDLKNELLKLIWSFDHTFVFLIFFKSKTDKGNRSIFWKILTLPCQKISKFLLTLENCTSKVRYWRTLDVLFSS